MIHNAKVDKPTKSGNYIAYFYNSTPYNDRLIEHVTALSVDYDKSLDGWNVSRTSRKSEMFPEAWSELITVEELKGVMNV